MKYRNIMSPYILESSVKGGPEGLQSGRRGRTIWTRRACFRVCIATEGAEGKPEGRVWGVLMPDPVRSEDRIKAKK